MAKNHDSVSGHSSCNLPDRRHFCSKLVERIERNGRGGFAVVCIDLDQFGVIEESMGSGFGDGLVRSVASRMSTVLRDGDTLARLGRDEFAILVEGISECQSAASLGDRILRLFEESFAVNGHQIEIKAGVGISVYPQDGTDVHTLLKNADYALCEASGRERKCYSSYRAASDTDALQQSRMEYSLRKALEHDELVVRYQPLVDMHTGEIRCVEALVRWEHPNMGVIPPRQFIPLAEQTGIIHSIGRFVRDTACKQGVDWAESGLPPVAIAVNTSPFEFREQGFAQEVVQTVENSGLDARWFVLELTEPSLMGDHDQIHEALEKIRESGISVCIDDFGKGYTSLNLLKDYPVDTVKIDRGFLREMAGSSRDETIARAMIEMAHALDIAVVAEGVETVEQLQLLQAMNCDLAQGYLFSRPLAAGDVASLIGAGPIAVPGIDGRAVSMDYSIRKQSA